MRDLLRAGGVLVILTALALAGWSWSDVRKAAPPPRTRIALLNLSHVIKSYDKFTAFQVELKEKTAAFQKLHEEKKKLSDKLATSITEASTEDERAASQKKLNALRREMEDIQSELKAVLEKTQGRQLKILYEDVEEATRRYARAHGLELVLHYNDHVTEPDRHSPANLARKMQAGACMPMYVTEGMDISAEIIADLNDRLRRKEI
jgi:Skp family chaperone for outer membrane proteins